MYNIYLCHRRCARAPNCQTLKMYRNFVHVHTMYVSHRIFLCMDPSMLCPPPPSLFVKYAGCGKYILQDFRLCHFASHGCQTRARARAERLFPIIISVFTLAHSDCDFDKEKKENNFSFFSVSRNNGEHERIWHGVWLPAELEKRNLTHSCCTFIYTFLWWDEEYLLCTTIFFYFCSFRLESAWLTSTLSLQLAQSRPNLPFVVLGGTSSQLFYSSSHTFFINIYFRFGSLGALRAELRFYE